MKRFKILINFFTLYLPQPLGLVKNHSDVFTIDISKII